MRTAPGLHNRYRPTTLKRLLGNAKAVAKLKGFAADPKNFPSAILFSGPPSAGKTTSARALALEVTGADTFDVNVFETNFGADRSIEDIRGLIQQSKLRPAMGSPRRFVICDEAHQLVANAPAAQAFLKPLEEPVASTTYILCSMEPEKFNTSTVGRAILERCVKIQMQAPEPDDLSKYLARIVKGEELSYVGEECATKIIENSRSFRQVANNMEAVIGYYNGLEKKPKLLDSAAVEEAVYSSASDDDVLAVRCLIALYNRKYVGAHKEFMDMNDTFSFINKLLSFNFFVLNQIILKGAKHPKVWGNTHSWKLWNTVSTTVFSEESMGREKAIEVVNTVHTHLAQLKLSGHAFSIDERMAMSATCWNLVTHLKTLLAK